jgi:hypothetical protein
VNGPQPDDSSSDYPLTKRQKEANLFRFFLDLEPLFVGEPIAKWSQPTTDPPDVLCVTASGKEVGVELGSWIDQQQMDRRKQRERIETDILKAIGKQQDNPTRFKFVWLHPRDTVRMHEINTIEFRHELFALVRKADREWSQESWEERSKIVNIDVANYPVLAKALDSIRCFPLGENDTATHGLSWIGFPNWGGAYHPQSMVDALNHCLREKRGKYPSNKLAKSFEAFVLVIHYDQALIYNSPVHTPDFGFDDIVISARTFLDADPGAFTHIFLLIAVEPGGCVFKLYP